MNQKKTKEKNCLWKYRKKMGFSQKDVAYLLDHHNQSQVCNWEKGKKDPSLDNALRLAIIYRKPVDFLFHSRYLTIREGLRYKEEELHKIKNL